jgi:NitT/TauT family transport system ATP-binding protein
MIELRNAGKTFRRREGRGSHSEFQALASVDFEVQDNEFITLLGPSGCGKTTLLRMIAGLSDGFDGEILVDGVPVTGPAPDRAMVFQSFALMPWANVRRNVAFGLELRGDDKATRERVAQELIDLVGLSGFEESLPWELSGGMQQRVGLARALAVEPNVLLMDEPFGALDEQTKHMMQDELLRIWQESPKTVVFVTHSIDEAILLGDRVVVMATKPGRIVEVADVNIPRPRTRESELTPEFIELKQHLWSKLKSLQDSQHVSQQDSEPVNA